MKHMLLSMIMLLCLRSSVNGQSLAVDPFTSIKVRGNLSVELVKSEEYKVEYSIIKGFSNDLKISVENNLLSVIVKGNDGAGNPTITKATATIYYKDISSLTCIGAVVVKSKSAIVTPSLDIVSSLGSSCTLGIVASSVNVDASSRSSVVLKGTTDNINISVSMSASVSASDLTSKEASVTANSLASVSVYTSESISASASEGASISYKGNPKNKKIDSNTNGSVSGI